MKTETHQRGSSRYIPGAPYYVLAGCLALTALVTSYAQRLTTTQNDARLQAAIQSTESAIHNRVQTYVDLLVTSSAFFAGNSDVTAAEFRTFVERLRPTTRYPGVLGIGFSKRVPHSEKDSFLARMRRESYPDFKLWPDGARHEYHCIIYLEPSNPRNRAAIGFDMFTDRVRREAMERARDTGEAAASGTVVLKQEIDSKNVQPGFLICVPVYADGTPATVEERRDKLAGFIYSPFRVSDLLNGIFSGQNPGVDFSVRIGADQTVVGEVRYDPASPDLEGRRGGDTRTDQINIAGQPWHLVFVANERFDHAASYTPLVCLAGLLLTLALFGFTHSQEKEQRAAQRHAEELRRSKAQLEESEQRFRTMADHAPVLVWIAGPDKLCRYVNKPWCDFTGRKLEQELGQGWLETVHPNDLERYRETYQQAFDARQNFRLEYRLRHFDGLYRWMLNQGVPLSEAGGEFVGFIGSCIDITELKNTEEAIQKLNSELEMRVARRTNALRESHEQMESFTYTVAHDLRAPLRAMQGFAAALLEDYGASLDGQACDFMHRIMTAAQRMDALIQDLLAYSRISRTPLVLEKVKLANVVESVLSVLAAEIRSKQAVVEVQSPLPVVTGHAGTIETILTNLVSNALKFVREGCPPHVKIGASEEADVVRVWVEDNGIGIAPEYQDRIFKVFERLHGAESYPGTGIGLALVRKGAERMGGRVGLESRADNGSRFWIDLPR